VAISDQDVQAWVWLGQGRQNAGDRSRAIECYRKVLVLDPNNRDADKGLKILQGGASAPQGGAK
jgi:predicted TPR repeat methyltransferase